jgi:hypothetical protein
MTRVIDLSELRMEQLCFKQFLRYRGHHELRPTGWGTLIEGTAVGLRMFSGMFVSLDRVVWRSPEAQLKGTCILKRGCSPKYLSLSLSLWLYSPLDSGGFFSFLILYTVGRTPWTGYQLVARPLTTHTTTQTHGKCTQTSMPRVGLEPTTSVFEWAKTVHALDRTAAVIGRGCSYFVILRFLKHKE